MSTLRKLVTGSFARFLLVGVFNTLVGLSASFLFFNVFGLGYWASTFAGNTIGAVVSYALNRSFTFRSTASVASSWWRFALVILICYGISYGAGMVLAKAAGALLPDVSAKLLHNGAILVGNGLYVICNYVGHKYFTFRRKEELPERGA
ncbi:GtrA family protein [Paenibacillus athensensis]|uniref:Polysaccharide biosynthesis protein GtrA n=1 Tax=Paenibacillus athensensis TaxID=1967502 RepID=A0A4Y8PPV3_9BACL|nr:GtrA family protein [Paenibacillus athensensis]MCD1259447.1 GtrA family protein [Paenibacillus athensensis]